LKLNQSPGSLVRFVVIPIFIIISAVSIQAQGQGAPVPVQPPLPVLGSVPSAASVPPRDPQAMSILNQSLEAAGGAKAIAAIADYTATGKHVAEGEQSSVTLRGLHGWEFRMDISGSKGTHSSGVHKGMVFEKAEGDTVNIPQQKSGQANRYALPVWTPMFPAGFVLQAAFVAHVLSGKVFGVAYNGTTEINGHSAFDIQVISGPFPAGTQLDPKQLSAHQTRDLFIDSTNYQIVAFRETTPRSPTHEVDYDDYKAVDGVQMPFTISELFGGHSHSTIHIDQFVFNTGLQPTAFDVQ